MIKVAINGYGRIGRLAHRVVLERYAQDIDIVAINAGSSTDIKGWMYLLKYDTTYGPILDRPISYQEAEGNSPTSKLLGYLLVGNTKIPVYSEKDPTLLPWKDLNVDVVIESTGHFTTEEKLKTHLQAGAKAAVLSAPVKEGDVNTYILSVNAKNYNGEKLISNASCTTNCIAPVAKVMVDAFGVEKAMMTTMHGYTADQELQDGGHKDYRRARAAAQNIVPTTTGATIAAAEAVPELKGIFAGLALRVPVAAGSISDSTFIIKRQTSKEEVNDVFRKATQSQNFEGILMVTEDPLVSSDIIGNPYSAIVDLSLTQVLGNLVKVVAWYDNEYGYANRLVEEVIMVGSKLANII
ncbi:MAG: type I glyceraldehyde-3-phosphate dehydrogenase [Patescibacteria group bacterium]|nr:type I glyceraldehyde-3-phosphate dehydrogenase [Patescibacteria group bacterium]